MTLPTLIAVPAIALGCMLIALGLRRRRDAPHRHCARCGYDLSAHGDDVPCPECGAELTPFAAVLFDSRPNGRRRIAAGIALLALASVHLGTLAVKRIDRINWQSHKPAAWLVYETQSSDSDHADAALDELFARAAQGILSNERIRSLAQAGLEMHADENTEWNPRWGSLVEFAFAADLLSIGQKHEYLARAVDVKTYLDEYGPMSISRNDRLAREQRPYSDEALAFPKYESAHLYFAARPVRTGRGSRIIVEHTPLELNVAGWAHPDPAPNSPSQFVIKNTVGLSKQFRTRRLVGIPLVIDPGNHVVHSRWTIAVRFEDDPPDQALVREFKFDDAIIVQPPGDNATPIVTDAASTEILKSAFKSSPFGLRTHKLRKHPGPVSILYLRFTTGPVQQLKEGDPLAPFNGSVRISVFADGKLLATVSPDLPNGFSPLIVENPNITSIDLLVRPDFVGQSRWVRTGVPPSDGPFQPVWMGPPFAIKNIPVTWYETIDEATLTDDEREAVYLHEPFPPSEDPQ